MGNGKKRLPPILNKSQTRIIYALGQKEYNIHSLSKYLNKAYSTIHEHINKLEKEGFLIKKSKTDKVYATKIELNYEKILELFYDYSKKELYTLFQKQFIEITRKVNNEKISNILLCLYSPLSKIDLDQIELRKEFASSNFKSKFCSNKYLLKLVKNIFNNANLQNTIIEIFSELFHILSYLNYRKHIYSENNVDKYEYLIETSKDEDLIFFAYFLEILHLNNFIPNRTIEESLKIFFKNKAISGI